jgi:acylphosphatase
MLFARDKAGQNKLAGVVVDLQDNSAEIVLSARSSQLKSPLSSLDALSMISN